MFVTTIEKRPAASIGEGVVVKGAMVVPGWVQVDGTFEGDLTAETIIIGRHGQVTGKTTAQRVEVMGQMRHQVYAQHLLVQATGVISGSTTYSVLEIARGGVIEGPINRVDLPRKPDNSADGSGAFR